MEHAAETGFLRFHASVKNFGEQHFNFLDDPQNCHGDVTVAGGQFVDDHVGMWESRFPMADENTTLYNPF